MDELKIIKYLDGEMSPAEQRAFEEEIRMNPPLAEELERYRQIQELAWKLLGDEESADKIPGSADKTPGSADGTLGPAVEKEISEAVRDFRNQPGSFDKVPDEYRRELEAARKNFLNTRDSGESPDRNASIPVIRRIWYRAAAIIILGLILSIWIFKPFKGSAPDEIYARYSKPFQKTEQVMEMARTDNDFLFAVEVFEAGDYERAVALFEMLADSSLLRSWSLFYIANSYMSMNRSAEAIELFQEVIREGDPAVVPHARWQLALSYIRIGEPELARKHLDILAGDPVYRSDAKRILRIVY